METVRIDNRKLADELAKRGITRSRAGIAVGHSEKYFSNQCVDKKAVEAIEKIYGIPYSAYSCIENSEESVEMVNINCKRLAELLGAKGVRMNTAGRAVGMSYNYFRNGRIRKSATDSIEQLYGIKLEQYQEGTPTNGEEIEKAEEKQPAVVNVQIDYNELYKTIYSSVYEAVKMALKEI